MTRARAENILIAISCLEKKRIRHYQLKDSQISKAAKDLIEAYSDPWTIVQATFEQSIHILARITMENS